jgi:hypothetical protein
MAHLTAQTSVRRGQLRGTAEIQLWNGYSDCVAARMLVHFCSTSRYCRTPVIFNTSVGMSAPRSLPSEPALCKRLDGWSA